MWNYYAWHKTRELEQARRQTRPPKAQHPRSSHRSRKRHGTIARGWPPLLADLKFMLEQSGGVPAGD
jgi:hypothetical protein